MHHHLSVSHGRRELGPGSLPDCLGLPEASEPHNLDDPA